MHDIHVIKKPVLTEKSTQAMEDGTYTFVVDRKATKGDIKVAIERLYGVNVDRVRTAVAKGTMRRLRYGYVTGGDTKRAMVRLVEGQTIELF